MCKLKLDWTLGLLIYNLAGSILSMYKWAGMTTVAGKVQQLTI